MKNQRLALFIGVTGIGLSIAGCGSEPTREVAAAEIQNRQPPQSQEVQAKNPDIKDWDGGKGGK